MSTDDEDMMRLARKNNVDVIRRPPELYIKEALGEEPLYMDIRDVFRKEVVYDGVKNRDVLEDYRKYILSISQKGIKV